ncbi:MAG: 7-cyano-7-deazaguanine synthase QueC [Bdellovibrio sp.]|nr:7-cyano-7-deazaguanine synthase QueC [Bdellovibrio sp.]
MKRKSVILLSAGLDSSVNLYAAMKDSSVQLALTFDYGQRAAKKEIEYAKRLTKLNNISHLVIDIPWLKNLGNSSLTKKDGLIPTGKNISLDDKKISEKSAKTVWVPNRNGIFLNIAAGFAESIGAGVIIPGFNAEEAVTFPDNSFDFIRATRKTLSFSTANQVDVQCYTINMSKVEIVELGKQLMVPFQNTWPCYFDHENWCGQCESCQRAKRAFKLAHVDMMGNFEK